MVSPQLTDLVRKTRADRLRENNAVREGVVERRDDEQKEAKGGGGVDLPTRD